MREAKNHIEDIEKIARKEVRKNEKARIKQEKKVRKELKKEDRQQERATRKKEREYSLKGLFGKTKDDTNDLTENSAEDN